MNDDDDEAFYRPPPMSTTASQRSNGRSPAMVSSKSIKTRNEKKAGRLMAEAGQRTKASLERLALADENTNPNNLS